MHGILISTDLNPFVIKRQGRNTKGDLRITLKNRDDSVKLISIDVSTSEGISLSKGGFVRRINKDLGNIEPGQVLSFYADIFPTFNAQIGHENVTITVNEHLNNNYKQVKAKYSKEMGIRIA